MLFINNEKLVLPDNLILELRTELRGGKTLKFPKEFAKKTKDDKGNIVTEYPATRSIPYIANVDLDMDTFKLATKDSKAPRYVEVRFCTSFRGTKDKPEYYPASLTTLKTLYEEDAEEFWFLKYCSMFIKNGLNAKSNRNGNYSCIIDDPEKDEKDEAQKLSLIYEANGFIFNRTDMGGLPESKIRDIAAAFGVSDSVKGRLDGLKIRLKRAVEVDEIKGTVSGDPVLRGYAYLIKLATEDYDFSLRVNISKAIDCGIIEYVASREAWFFLADTVHGQPKKYEEKIVNCSSTIENKENALQNFFNRTPDIKDRFELKLKEKLGEGDADNNNDYEKLKSEKVHYEEEGDTEKLIETIEKMLSIKPKNPKLISELKNLKSLQNT